MYSTHPVTDIELWGRLVVGVFLVCGLPGHLLVTRHLERADVLYRLSLALAVGLFLVATLSALSIEPRVPFAPWTILPALYGVAILGGRIPGWRARVRQLWDPDTRISPATQWYVGLVSVLVLTGLVVGFETLPAPPHVFDTSNHAYMLDRIDESRSVDPDRVFDSVYGPPQRSYLLGWHASVALISKLSGVVSFQAMWILVLWLVALLPVAMSGLWREWRLPEPALPLAAVVLGLGHYTPLGILGWGGFGVLIASYLVPWLVLPLVRWFQRGGRGAALALGVAFGALLHIHASEVPVVGFLVAVTLWQRRQWPSPQAWRDLWALAGAGALTGHHFLTEIVGPYLEDQGTHPEPLRPLGKTLEDVVHAAGRWEVLRGLWPLALGFGLRTTTRPVAIAAAAIGTIAVLVGSVGDPISGLLASPFYRQMPRVLYLLMFFLGPLIGWLGIELAQRTRRWGSLPHLGWAGLVAVVLIVPAQPELIRLYRAMHAAAPLSGDDLALAPQIADAVPVDAWVANVHNDGSVWLAHASRRSFWVPCQWPLGDGDRQAELVSLLDQPWGDSARSLADQGVDFVFLREPRVEDPRVHPRLGEFRREALDRDPRFQAVLGTNSATLYRIDWNH